MVGIPTKGARLMHEVGSEAPGGHVEARCVLLGWTILVCAPLMLEEGSQASVPVVEARCVILVCILPRMAHVFSLFL